MPQFTTRTQAKSAFQTNRRISNMKSETMEEIVRLPVAVSVDWKNKAWTVPTRRRKAAKAVASGLP